MHAKFVWLAAVLCLAAIGCGGNLKTSPCTTEADCKLIDDYCACECAAAISSETAPTCDSPCETVVALCDGRAAACVDGACAVK